ncbi:MAG: arsenate reductase (glutaredoxin) [Rickettsiales bacterium]|nr:arsenate reductase (glutaredoxin) [Rickettsiales bacterium]
MNNRFPITIYHNPQCGTSRNALAMIRDAGHEPTVIEYLKQGWDRATLTQLLSAMQLSARDVLRVKGTNAEELGLLSPDAPEEQLIEAMIMYPVLVNRPIVITPVGVKLCRPAETVQALL